VVPTVGIHDVEVSVGYVCALGVGENGGYILGDLKSWDSASLKFIGVYQV